MGASDDRYAALLAGEDGDGGKGLGVARPSAATLPASVITIPTPHGAAAHMHRMPRAGRPGFERGSCGCDYGKPGASAPHCIG